jgi:hypothetical protein
MDLNADRPLWLIAGLPQAPGIALSAAVDIRQPNVSGVTLAADLRLR